MSGTEPDISDEISILTRLAEAHKVWRDQRPQPVRPSGPRLRSIDARALERLRNPEPQDVEVIRNAPLDPLGTAITSQLSVVGWRLYAKGGVGVLTSVYRTIERDHHPGFVYAMQGAWRGLGFSHDRRGVWNTNLL